MRKIAHTLALTALIGAAIPAHAESVTWYDVVDSNLRALNPEMICDYVNGSARNITIDAYDQYTGRTVVSARYDFRCGNNTASDTVHMTFKNGSRLCHAYAFYGKRCDLDGDKIDA